MIAGMLLRLGLAVLFFAIIVTAAQSLQGASPEEPNVEKVLASIGGFYRDVLKAGGSHELISECIEQEDFSGCIEMQTDAAMDARYNSQAASIRHAAKVGQEYGINYLDVPFVRDLLKED